jgi:putative transposase
MGGCFYEKNLQDILIDSFDYCQKEKGLLLHAWCVMSNHIHMVTSSKNGNLSDILRDFKKHTSKTITKAIEANYHESRKDWILRIFKEYGTLNSRNREYQFWQQDNCPQELYSPEFTVQKLGYTHQNPVRAGIVERAEDYVYSSAKDYKYMDRRGLLDVVFL